MQPTQSPMSAQDMAGELLLTATLLSFLHLNHWQMPSIKVSWRGHKKETAVQEGAQIPKIQPP